MIVLLYILFRNKTNKHTVAQNTNWNHTFYIARATYRFVTKHNNVQKHSFIADLHARANASVAQYPKKMW